MRGDRYRARASSPPSSACALARRRSSPATTAPSEGRETIERGSCALRDAAVRHDETVRGMNEGATCFG
jgi:hypothetical protein